VPPPTFNRALGHRHYRHSPADIATRHPQVPKPSARKRARSGTLCSAPWAWTPALASRHRGHPRRRHRHLHRSDQHRHGTARL